MKLVTRFRDEDRVVEIERLGGRVRVKLDERSINLEVRRLADGVRSFLHDGNHHELLVRHLGSDRYEIAGAQGSEIVIVQDPLTHLAASAHDAQVGSASEVVKAYMPGRVVAVLVSEGATVEPGQGIVVLEAMKMENEIQADRSGTVSRLFVSEGQAVEGGDPLYQLQ